MVRPDERPAGSLGGGEATRDERGGNKKEEGSRGKEKATGPSATSAQARVQKVCDEPECASLAAPAPAVRRRCGQPVAATPRAAGVAPPGRAGLAANQTCPCGQPQQSAAAPGKREGKGRCRRNQYAANHSSINPGMRSPGEKDRGG